MTNLVMLIGPGRYRLTRQALESLAAHTNPATTPYTLTMVLDEPDFRTSAICSAAAVMLEDIDRFGNHVRTLNPRIAIVRTYNSGHTLSQLKNLGVTWSEQRFGRGDWLYISDSDVWFSPGWLEKLTMVADCSERHGFRLWGGQVHPFHQAENMLMTTEDDDVAMAEHSILDGPSWLMRWSTWNQYGPFDRTTAPGVCQSEEYPFCQRLTATPVPDCKCGCHVNKVYISPCLYCFSRRCNDKRAHELALGGGRIGVIHPHVVVHTGLTHLDGHDCVGRAEREKMIPEGVLAE